ncbi:hypothetical protein M8J76_000883 [Diaphorina citri]|nr:hypothetical protein M8J76_000883 [Diaphorina citri]
MTINLYKRSADVKLLPMLSVVDISGHGDVWTLIYHTSEAEKEPARQKRGQRDRKGASKTEKGPARQKRGQRDRKGARDREGTSKTKKGPARQKRGEGAASINSRALHILPYRPRGTGSIECLIIAIKNLRFSL